MKQKIKINFADFGNYLNFQDNFIINTLRERFDVELSDNPDYLFFSVFGFSHLKYDCVKILYIGENITPDFNICDYAMAFDHIEFGDRYLRLPLYQNRVSFPQLQNQPQSSNEELLGRKFCSIVVSNLQFSSPHRERFFKLLSEYKQVDSGGMLWNNVGGCVPDKIQFVSQYKFNIAFENSSVQGYTTEKIMEAMVANSLPIYWGNELVGKDFNPASFVNVNDFASLEDAVQYVVDLDRDDAKYLETMRQPLVRDESVFAWKDRMLDFIENIVRKPKEKQKYLSPYGMQMIYRQEMLSYRTLADKLRVKKMGTACKILKNRIKEIFSSH